jgi:uncharacterized protein (DUF2267 family)
MTTATITAFDRSIEKTNIWLSELLEDLGWESHEQAYHALRAVLHALRDRLPVNEAVHLAAQLPMLVRGFYYEDWKPAQVPVQERSKGEFLAHVAAAFRRDVRVDAEQVARAVFKVLAKHISAGEIDDVRANLPTGIRDLWPE